MKRYKLTLRSPSSKIVRPFSDIEDKADKFILKVQNLLKSGLYDPEFTINLDGSGLCTESNRTKTSESKGTTHMVVRSSNKDKENTTVLLEGSMTGEKLMPMVILKGKRNTLDVVIPKDVLVHWREAGSWMDREVFKKYIRLVLKEWSAKIPLDKRGLLLLDNFKGHINDEIKGLLRDIRIDVQKFSPNTTPYSTPRYFCKWRIQPYLRRVLETVQRGYNIYYRKIEVNNQEELEDDEEVQNTDMQLDNSDSENDEVASAKMQDNLLVQRLMEYYVVTDDEGNNEDLVNTGASEQD